MAAKAESRLGEAPVISLLVEYAGPAILATAGYSVYSTVNALYITWGIGPEAAGGIGLVSPVLYLLSALSTTVGGGGAALVSWALGRKDREGAARWAAGAFLAYWGCSALVALLGTIFLDPLLAALGATPGLLPFARDYGQIMILGSVTATGFSAIIRAEGAARYAMAIWLVPIAVNVVLDPVLILLLHLGVRGAALSTVACQTVSLAMSLHFFFLSGRSALGIRARHFAGALCPVREVLTRGFPSFAAIAGQSLALALQNNALHGPGGGEAISVLAIVGRINVFFIIPTTGLVQAFQPVAAYSLGQGRPGRFRAALRGSALALTAWMGLVSLVVWVLAEPILGIFTADPALVALGARALRLSSLAWPLAVAHQLLTASFQAGGRTGQGIIVTLLGSAVFLAPVLALASGFGLLDLVWLAPALSYGLALLPGVFFLVRMLKGRDFRA